MEEGRPENVQHEGSPGVNGLAFHGYGRVKETREALLDSTQEDAPLSPTQLRVDSPGESPSTPDDTPSVEV